jgi:hypothetical protein
MTDKNRPQSPIFIKTYEFLLWLLPLTIKFPKSQRFLLAERLGRIALDFYECIISAVQNSGNSLRFISEADLLLVKIRFYIRLSFDLHCISVGQFEFASKKVDELGRLLGGWIKKVKKTEYNV